MIEIPEWYNASVLVDGNLEAGRADKVAIYCGDEEVTYGALARHISRFGHALRALGVDREDRVLLMLNDTPSFPTAFFAVMRIGAIPIRSTPCSSPRTTASSWRTAAHASLSATICTTRLSGKPSKVTTRSRWRSSSQTVGPKGRSF